MSQSLKEYDFSDKNDGFYMQLLQMTFYMQLLQYTVEKNSLN